MLRYLRLRQCEIFCRIQGCCMEEIAQTFFSTIAAKIIALFFSISFQQMEQIVDITPALPSMRALLIIDVQNDFLPGDALAVPGRDDIIPLNNNIQTRLDLVVATGLAPSRS